MEEFELENNKFGTFWEAIGFSLFVAMRFLSLICWFFFFFFLLFGKL